MNCFEKSLIVGLMDGNGVWQEDMVDVEQIILDYYSDLCTSSGLTNFAELVDAIKPKVTHEMYSNLIMQFNANEVKKALKQMYPLKAPDLDSMPLLFYQHFWPTVGDVVTKTVLHFLKLGIVSPNFNDTYIFFIPKVREPKYVIEFHPISLCNVIYKLASKKLANRLKKVLPSIIRDTYSAFVHERLITDNVLVAFETMHLIS